MKRNDYTRKAIPSFPLAIGEKSSLRVAVTEYHSQRQEEFKQRVLISSGNTRRFAHNHAESGRACMTRFSTLYSQNPKNEEWKAIAEEARERLAMSLQFNMHQWNVWHDYSWCLRALGDEDRAKKAYGMHEVLKRHALIMGGWYQEESQKQVDGGSQDA